MLASSAWRQRRLLILCYHGLALKDEHKWGTILYVTPVPIRRRMEILARGGYEVLHLSSAIKMLQDNALPPKSVVITFDDGFHDFYKEAFPVLREFGFPATVYQTTYYSDYSFPIFNLVLSYIFWRARERRLDGTKFELQRAFALSAESNRVDATQMFRGYARDRCYTPAQKDELASQIALELGVDYAEIRRLQMLQLMTAAQIAEISAEGFDIQLHTHRHRTPLAAPLFLREIRDNREWIAMIIGKQASHFCYPSGVHREEFLPWLREEHIVSATTCEVGLASCRCNPLLLPRLLDSNDLTEVEFEGWLTGVSSLLPRRRLSRPLAL